MVQVLHVLLVFVVEVGFHLGDENLIGYRIYRSDYYSNVLSLPAASLVIRETRCSNEPREDVHVHSYRTAMVLRITEMWSRVPISL